MSRASDEAFMRLAIEASRAAVAAGNRPFGAALVKDGAVLKVSVNQQMTAFRGQGDCTAHAEIVLIREASLMHGAESLPGSTVYASGEPCAMCSGALFWAGVARVVYGASTLDIMALLGGPRMPLRCAEVLGAAEPKVAVDGPVLADAAIEVLKEHVRRSAAAVRPA